MNFLAHLYLSGNYEEIMVGNFIGDYVKGKEYLYYPENIRKGIMMHRFIDSYTDKHPVAKKSRQRVQNEYHKYSSIIIDIFYNFFLASEWNNYHPVELSRYVDEIFFLLKKHYYDFPQGIKNWFPNFIRNNWLISYSSIEGIRNVLYRMSSRTSLPNFTEFAIDVLRYNEKEMREEFHEFFASITAYVEKEFSIQPGNPFDISR
jgi:acyl carrier protein phosphodiesterase